MKKYYPIIFMLLISCLSAFAQPVLNSTDFTSDYSYKAYDFIGDTSGLSPGGSGANQVWDFSTLSFTFASSTSVVPLASVPNSSGFPTANYCWKTVYADAFYPDSYTMFKISATTLELLGFIDVYLITNYPDPETIFEFPYTYNTVINDTYQYEIGGTIYPSNSTYDAYGTVKTPYGTYTDVIRRKAVYDSGISYAWFKTNPFSIIMTADFSATDVYISVYENTTLGVKENEKELSINVYPNPATNQINLQLPNEITIDKVIITELTGKTVLELTQNLSEINVQKLGSGMYILQAFSGKEKFQCKFVKE
jgi:hypothetical protein